LVEQEGSVQRHFDEELNELKAQLLRMGGLAEKMINTSVTVLVEKNLDHARVIMEYEDQVNDLHVEIDERCMELMARQTPVAGDLRTIIAALKINNDLERIGDQVCNITKNTLELLKAPRNIVHDGVVKMAEVAGEMLRESLDSYVKRDTDLAGKVLAKDDRVDRLHHEVVDAMMNEMKDGGTSVVRGLDLIMISKSIEKIGDHATNIAEDVIFMVKAKTFAMTTKGNRA
jgi:phosphate transport system protein